MYLDYDPLSFTMFLFRKARNCQHHTGELCSHASLNNYVSVLVLERTTVRGGGNRVAADAWPPHITFKIAEIL